MFWAMGNATVCRVSTAGDEPPVAVKLLNPIRVTESYLRLAREVAFLREHGNGRGVLPLIDAYLPDIPTRSNGPGW